MHSVAIQHNTSSELVIAMDASAPKLELLDKSAQAEGLDLASQIFYRINRLIPPNQKILDVPPTRLARDAVAEMHDHGYSQVPVVKNGVVLGVFSDRSFAKEAASASLEELKKQKCAPGDLPVDEFLEKFEFARVTEEMSRVFDAMEVQGVGYFLERRPQFWIDVGLSSYHAVSDPLLER